MQLGWYAPCSLRLCWHLEAGFRGGASDDVTKPIHAAELLAKVRRCLGE